jgi:hypothetical protein
MTKTLCRLSLALAIAVWLPALSRAAEPATGEARAFAYDQGIVDLLVIGAPAKLLYARLPGRGKKSECSPEAGLYKGNGKMQCLKSGEDYSCHVWLDVPQQKVTDPETDDC